MHSTVNIGLILMEAGGAKICQAENKFKVSSSVSSLHAKQGREEIVIRTILTIYILANNIKLIINNYI